jgi:hypothetical protein
VKLLLDQNLSPRLLQELSVLYTGSTHVRDVGLDRADDESVWRYAAAHTFVIVTKDADFRQRSFLQSARVPGSMDLSSRSWTVSALDRGRAQGGLARQPLGRAHQIARGVVHAGEGVPHGWPERRGHVILCLGGGHGGEIIRA